MKLADISGTKEKAYLKAKIEELETNNKIKNIMDLYRGISEFKKGYRPRTNIVKDEKGDLVRESHSVWTRWRNHFCQLLNVDAVNNVRQTEIRKAEPLAPESSAFEFEVTIGKLKSRKSPGIDQTLAERIIAGGRTIRSEIRNHNYFISNKDKLPEDCSKYGGIPFCQLCAKFYPTSCSQDQPLSY